MKHRILSAVLLLYLAATCTVSCAKDENPHTDTSDTTEAVTESPYIDDLPSDLKFGGEKVYITLADYSSAFYDEMYSDEREGNRFNEAVYLAILSVEERLETDLEYTRREYTWNSRLEHYTSITSRILADDDAFDILFDSHNYNSQMTDNEYFLNLAETKYINLGQPWYNQTLIENSPTDYIHAVIGDFSIGNLKNSYILYFNQDLLTAHGITENLYETVDSGEWTLDKFKSVIAGTYTDDGNTVRDAGDRYGLTFGDDNKYYALTGAFGMHAFNKTADGFEFIYDNERNVDIFQTVVGFVNSNEDVLAAHGSFSNTADYFISSGGANSVNKQFVDGNALFTVSLIADAASIIPEVDFTYGILPLPKYDEAQEYYLNSLQRHINVLIPATCRDVDRASAVIEALTSEFHTKVIPEYVEVTLKTRYSPTDNISRMFDIATNTITFYPDALYGSSLTLPDIKEQIVYNNPNWVSVVASVKEAILNHLNAIN